jgi:acetyl esterase/lipase
MFGARVAPFARVAPEADPYVPEFLLAVAGLTPAGVRGAEARDLYRSLWETLDTRGIDRADVAAATVFTTGDVAAEMARIADAIAARHPVEIEDLHLDPDDGAAHERFCELVGTARMPQFQQGTPPFDTQGLFELDGDGVPAAQREEVVPVVLTLPRREMPADGYPLVVYFHGSGGRSSQVVDRGPVTEPGGAPRCGEGPAHVLAAHGFAAVGSAHPLNPERLPGSIPLQYINFANLAAYRDTFRQGTIEQRLLLDAMGRLTIDPALLAACQGPTLPEGAAHFAIRPAPVLAMGQSMGAQYANMVGATNPHVGAVAPTGSGGMWSLLVLTVELVPGADTAALVAAALGTGAPLTHLHPGLQLLQSAWEAADPIAYAGRIARRPLPGYAPRPIFQPTAKDDPDFPIPIYDAMALAHGNQQAGAIVWPTMQAALALAGLDGLATYPVEGNRHSAAGEPYTGVVAQYEGDGIHGILSPHHIAFQLDAVKHQYGCFFATFEATGAAVVPAPAALGAPCL